MQETTGERQLQWELGIQVFLFFQGIIQVTSSCSKYRNSSFFSSFSAAGTVTFSFLFQFLYPHTRFKTSPLTSKQLVKERILGFGLGGFESFKLFSGRTRESANFSDSSQDSDSKPLGLFLAIYGWGAASTQERLEGRYRFTPTPSLPLSESLP